MISSKSVSICNRFHARWANSGEITISKGCTPLWCPRSRVISSPSGTNITSLETRDSRLSHREDFMIHASLWHNTAVWQTDGQTDRQTDASAVAEARLALHAVARKKREKIYLFATNTIRTLLWTILWPANCAEIGDINGYM